MSTISIIPRSTIDYIKNIYDKFGKDYHQRDKNPSKAFCKQFIVIPAMTSFIRDMVRSKKVLDLACGSGTFTRNLASWGAKVIGLDFSKILIEIASKENPSIKFCVGDARKIPFKNLQFDIISSSLMVHYVKNIKLLFNEVSRILKKRGLFIFSIHHPISEILKKIEINGKRVFLLMPYFHKNKYTWNMIKGMEMISYHHTFENIINSLNDAGFVIERLLEPNPPKRSEKYNKKSYDRTSKYPSFCIIKARKI